jgi:Dynamin GTPase effector domain
MAIDHEFMFGVERDIQITLLKGLRLSGQDGFKIARELIQEPHNVSACREELQKKLDRLYTARNELLHVGL